MSRRIAVLFVFATALSALTCARTPPERQLIEAMLESAKKGSVWTKVAY